MISFSLVDVKNIISENPRSDFSEDTLDYLAEIILKTGGLIKPLVVKETGEDTYLVIDGHLEYYAAVKAREKDPRKGEMVNAFVISPKDEKLVLQQAEAFREYQTVNHPATTTENNTTKLEQRITNIELRLEKHLSQLREERTKEKQELEIKLKEFKDKIPKLIEPLTAFNTLNASELLLILQNVGISSKTATKLVEAIQKERTKKEFTSVVEVVKRITGLSEKRMLSIIDNLSRTLVYKD
ncbi:ParB domain protein nuclease [Gloeocapsa sp. PCC 7428]|uniref:ParB N-terminal domain-containing protein n=1 Tax=Gloeocapsa sp. PCC 7428 TaxID=1173026 RepID=UPI0002A61CD5|nr:ParB N-terminal domain-containing protein [Gloeocapsa sp. PCC 7428]AFZ28742.1 ParB domain protein nuclease [Gloeocapsa sp. PCC 7428]